MTHPEPGFSRDPEHWLYRHSAAEWIRAAMVELERAAGALQQRNPSGGAAGLKRAAGMSLNGALVVRPRQSWGRTYVEHLRGLSLDEHAPQPVRDAARLLVELGAPAPGFVPLRTPGSSERWLEAARTVMAHSYALVYGSVGRSPGS